MSGVSLGYEFGETYQSKCKLVKEFLQNNLGVNIDIYIKEKYEKLGKTTLFRHIVNNQLGTEDCVYLSKKLGGLSHLKDKRTPEEYACDLVLGWIMEDAVLDLLKNLGYRADLVSADRNREFLKRPKASADMVINLGEGKKAKLELVKDYTSFWKKNEKIHLRDSKYLNLKGENGVLLGIDFQGGNFFLLSVVKTDAKRIESHWPYGGKPVYELSLRKVEYHPLESMSRVLKNFFEGATR